MQIISRYPQKKDFSGQCKTKEWGFVKDGQVFWGYATKKSVISVINDPCRVQLLDDLRSK